MIFHSYVSLPEGIFLKLGVLICFPGRFFLLWIMEGQWITGAISPAIWAINRIKNWAYELNIQPKWKLLTPFPSRNPCAIWIKSFGTTPNVMEFHPSAVGPTWETLDLHMVYFTDVHVSFSVLTTFPTSCPIDFYVKIFMCTLWSQFPLQTWFLHCSHWYTLLISMLISMIPHFILPPGKLT